MGCVRKWGNANCARFYQLDITKRYKMMVMDSPVDVNLDATIELLLEHGCYLFPVKKDKTPYYWCKWKEEATNDRENLQDLYKHAMETYRQEGGNLLWLPQLAIATGPSNLLVWDIDNKEGQWGNGFESWSKLEMELGDFPDTWMSLTPSDGAHLFTHGIGPNSAGTIGRFIDTRGVGGYVLAPGAIRMDGKCYRWQEGRSPRDLDIISTDEIQDWVDKLNQGKLRERLEGGGGGGHVGSETNLAEFLLGDPIRKSDPGRNRALFDIGRTLVWQHSFHITTEDELHHALSSINEARCRPILGTAPHDKPDELCTIVRSVWNWYTKHTTYDPSRIFNIPQVIDRNDGFGLDGSF
jgi:hypothetical protein